MERILFSSEIRAVNAAGKNRILGFIPYDSLSKNLGGFKEKIKRGAFANALKRSTRILGLFNHDHAKPLCNSEAGTLRLDDGPDGLSVEMQLDPSISFHKDAWASVARGDIAGMSFGFTVAKDQWEPSNTPDKTIRTILEIGELFEVSPVTFPAYPATTAQARSRDKSIHRKATSMDERKYLLQQIQRALDESDFENYDQLIRHFDEQSDRLHQPEITFRSLTSISSVRRALFDTKGKSQTMEAGEVRNTQAGNQFRSFGEFLGAVAMAGRPEPVYDPRLTMRAATGLSEGISSDGGYLVQQDFAAGLIQNIWNNSEVLKRITKYQISSGANGLKINGVDETSRAAGSRSGGILMYWLSEAASKTASKPKFRQIELNLKKLIGLCYATDELLQDAAALEGVVRKGFNDEMDFMISDAIINGTGAGQPLGIMNSGCLVSVTKESGQPAATIQVENIIKMWARLAPGSQQNAVWLINNDCIPQLYTMGISVGTGGAPIFMPTGGVSQAPYSTLLGRPIIPIEQCQTIGTTGDVLLCDLSQYIGIDKGGMTSDVSIHVRFVYDESVFRFVYRFDGQPALRAAITPYKGSSNTLSPFVALATRA